MNIHNLQEVSVKGLHKKQKENASLITRKMTQIKRTFWNWSHWYVKLSYNLKYRPSHL